MAFLGRLFQTSSLACRSRAAFLWIRDVALQPEDYFMLTPADIRAHLAGLGIEPARLDMIELRLQAIHDEFVAAATRAAS